MMTLAANLNMDISLNYPESMPYHENAGIHATASGNCLAGRLLCYDSIRLFFNGQVECATRHDPHDPSPGNTAILLQPLARPALCLHCHNK
jgi:hypothetical protein